MILLITIIYLSCILSIIVFLLCTAKILLNRLCKLAQSCSFSYTARLKRARKKWRSVVKIATCVWSGEKQDMCASIS